MTKPKPEPLLWLNDARGQYIPRDFASSFANRAKHVTGVSDEEWAILEAGPDHEFYWDTWSDVEQNVIVTNDDGVRYFMNNDSDCWLIPVGMEWNDEVEGFVWPEEEQYDERI